MPAMRRSFMQQEERRVRALGLVGKHSTARLAHASRPQLQLGRIRLRGHSQRSARIMTSNLRLADGLCLRRL